MNASPRILAPGRFTVSRAPVLAAVLIAAAAGPLLARDFSPTGPMAAGRARAAAALSGAGPLLAGGSSMGSACLPTTAAELYDATAGVFTATGPMARTRCEARAVALDDGRVLVVGGVGTGIGDAEMYDPATGAFSPAGTLITERAAGFTLTKLSDGRVLVTGGDNFSGPIDTFEIYDPATGLFAPAGSMTTPRSVHTATLLDDGRVLLAGGGSGFTCTPVAQTAEIYDPLTGLSTPAAGPPVYPLWGHAEAKLPGGAVLLMGGEPTCGLTSSDGTRNAQLFDPATGTFAAVPDMLATHGLGLAATALPDGRVLVTGGISGLDPVDSGELYDPCAGSFGETAVMSSRRAFHAQLAMDGGAVLVAGGESSLYGVTRTADVYTASGPPAACPPAAIDALVDVVPETLNLKSQGRFITVFVGVPGRDARDIDARTIELSIDGAGALRPAAGGRGIGDHDGDGVVDLVLKFSRAEVTALAPVGRPVLFVVTGAMEDGTPFEGTDRVRVIRPGNGPQR